MRSKRVLFVREGTWAGSSQQENDFYTDALMDLFALEKHRGTHVAVAEIEVVDTFQEALDRFERLPNPETVVFVTRGMETMARQMKLRYPNVRVVVLTNSLPENDIIWADKSWMQGGMIRNILCGLV